MLTKKVDLDSTRWDLRGCTRCFDVPTQHYTIRRDTLGLRQVAVCVTNTAKRDVGVLIWRCKSIEEYSTRWIGLYLDSSVIEDRPARVESSPIVRVYDVGELDVAVLC